MTSLFSIAERTNVAHASPAESSWGFLNRVAHPSWDTVRTTLDGWFDQMPDGKSKRHLRKRFRDHDDNTHASAIWELLLHRLFLGAGYLVEFEPLMDGLTPDFVVTTGDGHRFLVEATTMNDSDETVALDRIESTIYEHLHEIHSAHFFGSVIIEESSLEEPDYDEIRRVITDWAVSTDALAATLPAGTDMKPIRLGTGGWIIQITPHPGRSKPGRVLGIFNGKVGWSDDGSRLRKRLNRKHHKYAALGLPILLAVLSTTGRTDDWDVTNALYGQDAITVDVESGEVVGNTRQPDGQWYRGDAWGAREVSAVLTTNLTSSGFLHRSGHDLWLHPDPVFALPTRLPWATTHAVSDALELEASPPRLPLDSYLDEAYTTNDDALGQWQLDARGART